MVEISIFPGNWLVFPKNIGGEYRSVSVFDKIVGVQDVIFLKNGDFFIFCIFPVFPEEAIFLHPFCKFSVFSKNFRKNIFVNFCKFLQIFANFCKFLQIFANFYKFLQNFAKFCKIFANFGHFSEIFFPGVSNFANFGHFSFFAKILFLLKMRILP